MTTSAENTSQLSHANSADKTSNAKTARSSHNHKSAENASQLSHVQWQQVQTTQAVQEQLAPLKMATRSKKQASRKPNLAKIYTCSNNSKADENQLL